MVLMIPPKQLLRILLVWTLRGRKWWYNTYCITCNMISLSSHNLGVMVRVGVNIAIHDGVEGCVMRTTHKHAVNTGMEDTYGTCNMFLTL